MNEVLATELRVLRVRNKLTIPEAAKAIGIDQGTLSRYETNKTAITVETLEKLLNYYNVPITIFFETVCANMHE